MEPNEREHIDLLLDSKRGRIYEPYRTCFCTACRLVFQRFIVISNHDELQELERIAAALRSRLLIP